MRKVLRSAAVAAVAAPLVMLGAAGVASADSTHHKTSSSAGHSSHTRPGSGHFEDSCAQQGHQGKQGKDSGRRGGESNCQSYGHSLANGGFGYGGGLLGIGLLGIL